MSCSGIEAPAPCGVWFVRELRILRSKCAGIVEAPDVDRDHLGRYPGRSEEQAAAPRTEVPDRIIRLQSRSVRRQNLSDKFTMESRENLVHLS